MPLDLDRHAGLDSPLHRLEARARLVGLGVVIAGMAVVRSPQALPFMLATTALILLVSRIPVGFVVRRLRAALLFVTVLGVLLPLVSGGPVIWIVGPLAVHADGLWQFATILAKVLSIGTVALVLFGTAPLPVTVVAMQRLGLPALVADMTLFSYRAIHEIGTDLNTMRTAAGLRGLRWSHRPPGAPSRLATTAALVGSLFVSSHARAEQTHRAMTLRGYSGARPKTAAEPLTASDWLFVAGSLTAAAALVALEFFTTGWIV
jgi:cobalt/nickel transport system permease protein